MSDYRNPPIVEAVCQVVLQEPVDITYQFFAEVLHPFFSSEFPAVEHIQNFEVSANEDGPPNQTRIGVIHRTAGFRFWDVERKKTVLFDKTRMAVGALKPYPGGGGFVRLLQGVFRSAGEVWPGAKVTDVSLRYVDSISIAEGRKPIDYVHVPVLSHPDGQRIAEQFRHQEKFACEGITEQISCTFEPERKVANVDLDIGLKLREPLRLGSDELIEQVRQLKARHVRWFEGLVTPLAKESFNEQH